MELIYNYNDMQYTLSLTGKYNVIVGDSGTGKTQLAEFASRLESVVKRKRTWDIPIYGDSRHVLDIINKVTNSVIVIDEEISTSDLECHLKAIEKSPNWFIFCFRDDLGKIPYGIDNIFSLRGNARHRKMIPYFTRNAFTRTVMAYTDIITEDSKSSYYALQYKFPQQRVITSEGKGNLKRVIAQSKENSIIILDLCGVGCNIFSIMNIAQAKGSIIFKSKSFEHEVLLELLQSKDWDDITFPESEWLTGKYSSEEHYYEEQLKTTLYDQVGLRYSKHNSRLLELLGSGVCRIDKGILRIEDLGLSYFRLYRELESGHIANGNTPSLPSSLLPSPATGSTGIKQMNLQ